MFAHVSCAITYSGDVGHLKSLFSFNDIFLSSYWLQTDLVKTCLQNYLKAFRATVFYLPIGFFDWYSIHENFFWKLEYWVAFMVMLQYLTL